MMNPLEFLNEISKTPILVEDHKLMVKGMFMGEYTQSDKSRTDEILYYSDTNVFQYSIRWHNERFYTSKNMRLTYSADKDLFRFRCHDKNSNSVYLAVDDFSTLTTEEAYFQCSTTSDLIYDLELYQKIVPMVLDISNTYFLKYGEK